MEGNNLPVQGSVLMWADVGGRACCELVADRAGDCAEHCGTLYLPLPTCACRGKTLHPTHGSLRVQASRDPQLRCTIPEAQWPSLSRRAHSLTLWTQRSLLLSLLNSIVSPGGSNGRFSIHDFIFFIHICSSHRISFLFFFFHLNPSGPI